MRLRLQYPLTYLPPYLKNRERNLQEFTKSLRLNLLVIQHSERYAAFFRTRLILVHNYDLQIKVNSQNESLQIIHIQKMVRQ